MLEDRNNFLYANCSKSYSYLECRKKHKIMLTIKIKRLNFEIHNFDMCLYGACFSCIVPIIEKNLWLEDGV